MCVCALLGGGGEGGGGEGEGGGGEGKGGGGDGGDDGGGGGEGAMMQRQLSVPVPHVTAFAGARLK